jgi:hypothetical protein
MSKYKVTPGRRTPFVIDVLCQGDALRVAAMETNRTGITHTVDTQEDCRPGPYLDTIYCDMPGKPNCPVFVFEYRGKK